MRRTFLGLASMIALPLAFYACAGDEPAAPGPKPLFDAALPDTAVADTSVVDTSTARVIGGCLPTDFTAPAGPNGGDLTAQPEVTITFPTDSSPAQYTNRCAQVKLGTKVTFKGSFFNHPLAPTNGDMPSPITLTSTDPDGGSVVFTMPAKGTFGYECMFHPSIMFGAIQVVP